MIEENSAQLSPIIFKSNFLRVTSSVNFRDVNPSCSLISHVTDDDNITGITFMVSECSYILTNSKPFTFEIIINRQRGRLIVTDIRNEVQRT